jgi:hypothetical protein
MRPNSRKGLLRVEVELQVDTDLRGPWGVLAYALLWRAHPDTEFTPWTKHSFPTSSGLLSKLSSRYTVRLRKVVDRASMTVQH